MKKLFLIPLMTLVCSVMAWAADITTGADLKSFLTTAGTAEATVTEDVDISDQGTITMKGTKTLTINEGVTVYYLRQSSGPNIKVPAGTSLTLLGSGTIRPVAGADIDQEESPYHEYYEDYKGYLSVYNGNRPFDISGTLTVGIANDANNRPSIITTSICRGAGLLCQDGANVTINNIYMHAAYTAITVKASARVTINGGYIESVSTKLNDAIRAEGDAWWSYAIGVKGQLNVNDGTIVGVHGGLEYNSGAIGEIRGGSFYTQPSVGVSKPDNFYALYVSTNAVVNVYGGQFKVELPSGGANQVVSIGDNDAGTTFGIINLYGGLFQQKPYLSKRKAQDAEMIYPASVPLTSQWYSSFGTNVPMPAGYEYYDITEGEDYEAGYRYGVRPVAGKEPDAIDPDQQAAQEADPTYTIPWQQATTWKTAEVPEDNTIVTIPKDATVTVSKDEETKTAVADQVYVSQGATLKVETGTTLNIGEGGMNIGNGGQIVVEPGAVVTVGEAGIITTEDEALVIEATEEDQGVLLLHPEVTENTQPKATVKLVTKCKQVGANEFVWERFAIPTLDGAQTTFNAEHLDTVTIYGGGSFEQGLYEWDGSAWTGVSNWHDLKPSKGYQLTNNSMYGNVVYTFEGNLVGNVDNGYEFAESGFGFFGNSYTGDIDILKFFESFGPDMQKTIWIYDYYTDGFKAITETSYGSVYYGKRNARHGLITDIRSMQAFLMNTFASGASTQNVNYESAIWGNPKYGLVSTPDPAPAKRVAANEDMFTVYVAGATQEDEVSFIRSNAYSAAFDNGADASKWMNNGLNLYVATEDGELAAVASDEIVDMTIAFQSGNETEYTLGFDNLRGETFELRDVLTGAMIQMTEGATYTFSQEANTTVPARFQIIGARKVATGVENTSEGAAVQQKVIENGVLYILRDNKWYNAQGQIVK